MKYLLFTILSLTSLTAHAQFAPDPQTRPEAYKLCAELCALEGDRDTYCMMIAACMEAQGFDLVSEYNKCHEHYRKLDEERVKPKPIRQGINEDFPRELIELSPSSHGDLYHTGQYFFPY